MFTNHDSSSIRRVFRFILTLLLAMSFSASARAGQPQEIQAFAQDDSLVYLPLVLKRGPLMESSGILDPSFGDEGRVVTGVSGSADYVGAITRQPDGKLLVAGNAWGKNTTMDFTMVRYQPNGSLDTGFGSNGIVMTDFSGYEDWCRSILVQPDGKIVMAGYASNGDNGDIALARYNPDGSLDGSFGGDGRVQTDLYGGSEITNSMVQQADGKFVVVGVTVIDTAYEMMVARYNSDGSLDTTFSGDGVLAIDISSGADSARAVVLQPNEKIVIVGSANDVNNDFYVIRLNPDGSLDTSFDEDGMQLTDFSGGIDVARGVALQPDGMILVAGYTSDGVNQDIAVARYQSDGKLDSNFDGDGLVVTDIAGGTDEGDAIALQPDGKLLVAGYGTGTSVDFTAVRYNSNGSLDTSFSEDGKAVVDLAGRDDYGTAAVLQPDGKFVVAGRTYNEISIDFAAVRYNSDGSLDSSFDEDGQLVTNIKGNNDVGISVVLQPDGKLVMSGTADGKFTLVRYQPDGSLDASFSGDGIVMTDFGDGGEVANAVALQADGKLVAVGYNNPSTDRDFIAARYNPDGSLDATFGSDGLLLTDITGGDEVAADVLLQPDGKIVVVGGTSSDFAVVRYNPDGSLDPSFSIDGVVLTDFAGGNDGASSVALQPDGKIVVAGSANNGADSDFAVARYNPDGSLDNTFSGDGRVMTDFFNLEDTGNAVVLQPDGKIVVAGTAGSPIVDDFAVARYNPDGSLDTSFSGDGWVTIESGGPKHANAVVLQPNGKIVVAGWIVTEFEGGFPTDSDFALARFYPDGSLDTSFGSDGLVITNFESGRSECFEMALLPDGRIAAVGYVDTVSDEDFALVAYK